MFYSDDPVRDFERHDAEQERRLSMLPVCDYCDEAIQDEQYYEINGDCVCEECLDLYFKKDVNE